MRKLSVGQFPNRLDCILAEMTAQDTSIVRDCEPDCAVLVRVSCNNKSHHAPWQRTLTKKHRWHIHEYMLAHCGRCSFVLPLAQLLHLGLEPTQASFEVRVCWAAG